MRLRTVSGLVAFLFIFAGCGDSTEEDDSDSSCNPECRAGFVCQNGQCVSGSGTNNNTTVQKTPCYNLIACIDSQCPNSSDSCVQGCADQNPDGVDPFSQLASCADQNCPNSEASCLCANCQSVTEQCLGGPQVCSSGSNNNNNNTTPSSSPACHGPVSGYSPTNPPLCGQSGARVTIVYYADLQDPFTAKAHETLFGEVLPDYKGQVNVELRFYPLPFHKKARKWSRAALAAHKQGAFWQMFSAILANQNQLNSGTSVSQVASGLGLNMSQFESDLNNSTFTSWIDRDMQKGMNAGVQGTPNFFINGTKLVGAQPASKFRSVIDSKL